MALIGSGRSFEGADIGKSVWSDRSLGNAGGAPVAHVRSMGSVHFATPPSGTRLGRVSDPPASPFVATAASTRYAQVFRPIPEGFAMAGTTR